MQFGAGMHGGGVRVREAKSGDAGWREGWLEADIVGGKGGNTTVRGRARLGLVGRSCGGEETRTDDDKLPSDLAGHC